MALAIKPLKKVSLMAKTSGLVASVSQLGFSFFRTTPVSSAKALESNLKPRTMKFSDIRKHHILTEIAVLRPRAVLEKSPDDLADQSVPKLRLKGNPGELLTSKMADRGVSAAVTTRQS